MAKQTHNYKNLRRILEKLRQEIKQEFDRDLFLQDIDEYLCNGAYQKVHRMKKDENKYQWIKIGKRPAKKKSLDSSLNESKTEKMRKEIDVKEEDLNFLEKGYRELCNKYKMNLSRTDLNQGNKELRKFYETIRKYEIDFYGDKLKIDFLPGKKHN